MNKIFILTPYGNDYHTGHLVLLGPTLEDGLRAFFEQENNEMREYLAEKFVGREGVERFIRSTFPGRGFDDVYEIPWEERTPAFWESMITFVAAADLPWEVIDPNLSVPMVLAEYSGSC